MELIKLEINNYKSIKEPIVINFNDNSPIIFIGKNGSGKTNILEAINLIAEANSSNRYYGESINFKYNVHIQLNKEDFDSVLPNVKYNEKNNVIIATSNGQDLKIDRIESKDFVTRLKKEFQDIQEIANELEKEITKYEKILFKISHNEREELPIHSFKIKNSNGGLTNYELLKWQADNNIKIIRENINKIMPSFTEDDIFVFDNHLYISDYFNNFNFKLEYVKPSLAPFEEKYIKIDEESIKREIEKINLETEETCKKINNLLTILKEKSDLMKNNYESEFIKKQEENSNYKSFIQKIKQIICQKCVFLKNENNDVMFKPKENYKIPYYNDKSKSIIETYIKNVYEGEDKDEILKDINNRTLAEDGLKDFENYLNNNIPEFDKGMFNKITVENNDKGNIKILLHENTGEIVDLNNTSSGRRWYFSYYFMKSILNAGDMFIIDEPATMLHPTAQKEVLNELMQLSQKGVKVIYSTHSPYLVSKNNWQSVNFVSLAKGTKITSFDTKEEYIKLIKEDIDDDIFSLGVLVDKYLQNPKKIAQNCYNAIILKNPESSNKDSIENASKYLNLSPSTIESWRKDERSKKSRNPLLENIIKVAEYTNKDVNELFK